VLRFQYSYDRFNGVCHHTVHSPILAHLFITMGIPYSTQINAAFDQVTPLVSAGFVVLQTTKNIAILLAYIQIVTAVLLSLILFALLGLLFTMNPDLEKERQQLVTPVMHWLASWVFTYGRAANWLFKGFVVVSIAGFGLFLWQGSAVGASVPKSDEGGSDETPEEAT
jgi:hypothetical protein